MYPCGDAVRLAAHVVVGAGRQLGEVDGGVERAEVALVDGGELLVVRQAASEGSS